MREIKRSALVAQPPSRMFALINDIESYPQFVPWCTLARVESRSQSEIVATMAVKRGALNAQFTTRNRLEPDRRVGLELVEGPFRELSGEWLLTPIGEQGAAEGCRIELTLRFAFSNPVSAVVFEPIFQSTAGTLVDAFVARTKALYP